MSEETNPPANEPGGDGESDAPQGGAAMRIAHKRSKERIGQLSDENTALRARIAEVDAAEEERTESNARAAQDWKTLEGTLNDKLSKKDKRIAELEGNEEKRIQEDRHTGLVDALSKRSGVGNRTLISALARELKIEAPEELDDEFVADAHKKLVGASPETFKTTPAGGSRGTPGSHQPTSDTDARKQAVREYAESYGKGGKNQTWREVVSEG